MPMVGFHIDGRDIPTEEALALAAEGELPYPYPLLAALADQRNAEVPSASVIGGCLRRFELQRRYDYYVNVRDGMAALFGTAMHALMEKYTEPGVEAEYRMAHVVEFPSLPEPYNQIVFTGKSDYPHARRKYIGDFKSKAYVKKDFYPPSQTIVQLNVYHWLWVMTGHEPLESWELNYLDWSNEPKQFRGEFRPVEAVGKWVVERLYEWASHAAAGTLPAPIPSFHNKLKADRGICNYCPVLQYCEARWKEEQGGSGQETVRILEAS